MASVNLSRLQKTPGYFDKILDSLPHGMVFITFEGRVTTYNRMAETILGVSSRDIIDQSFCNYFTDDLFGYSMKEALTKHKVEKMTFATLKAKDQTKRQLEILNTFEKEGLIILIKDISEIRRSDMAILRSDKMREFGELAAMVAHEIRNPLGGIKGFAALLQRDLVEYPELHRLATYIVEGTDSLNRRVTNILDYSNSMELNFEPVDLVHFMQELILHLNADDSIDPRIELRTHSTKTELIASVDAAGLKSAIMNLASNAFQAMPEGGELLIDVDSNDKQAIIRVSDTGTGIAKENLERIFSPFFTTRLKGHGFGLTEVNKIVQAHGGQIEVNSEIGSGTTFTILLPLYCPQVESESKKRQKKPCSSLKF